MGDSIFGILFSSIFVSNIILSRFLAVLLLGRFQELQ